MHLDLNKEWVAKTRRDGGFIAFRFLQKQITLTLCRSLHLQLKMAAAY